MKIGFFIVVFFICAIPATAKHVAGGELFYEYLGSSSPGNSTYKITLRLFRDCFSTGPILENENVTVGIYENSVLLTTLPLIRNDVIQTITLNTAAFPCLVGNVNVCYQYGIWTSTAVLADNQSGYILSRIGCCRVDNISNLSVQKGPGSNYVAQIPGLLSLPTGHNSSPQYLIKDTALVCANKSFKLDFGATDPDNDVLTYSFCDAYTAANGSNSLQPPPNLDLSPLPYLFPYNGSAPLGAKVKIDPNTGVISGTAPPEGQYVVNVCITESRNGKAISEHRKDFILKVQNCDFVEAVLPDKIIQCNNFTVHFENLSTSSAIISYTWKFGDLTGNTSNNPTVDYTYADTGRYIASLEVTGPKGCVGDASTTVFVYPGFKPGFSVSGSCFQNPYQFNDSTSSKYGIVNSWFWNFGDAKNNADTSSLTNPTYLYPGPATNTISLVVGDSKGCIDSLHKDLVIRDKPLLQLPFKDTLICSIDTLAIPVSNTGVFTWTSKDTHILFANTSSPLVFPKDTAKYIVTVGDNGCINTDSVTVNVLQFITVKLGNDTLLCKTDTIRLHPVSDALSYQWTSSSGKPVAAVKYPIVQPLVTTKYYVTANLGKCQDRDTVLIKVVDYPTAIAGPDTTICFGNRIQLNGSFIGTSFVWSPTNTLLNANTTKPIAGPSRTTSYILTVRDSLGCPKPVSDTIVLTVIPPILANAGRDTFALPGQPIQLIATGGQTYIWSPEAGLSDPSIFNPVATLSAGTDSITYKVRVYNSQLCYAEDEVVIRVYKTGPDIFVPSAFTPNGDGKNDRLHPITIGISKLNYFNIYDRWGQLLFTTAELGKGWDGTYNGSVQPSAAYVFTVEGIDYTGKIVYRKGTVVLIR